MLIRLSQQLEESYDIRIIKRLPFFMVSTQRLKKHCSRGTDVNGDRRQKGILIVVFNVHQMDSIE